MSWRHVRSLTLVLLVLTIAAPLSSGDKGLWLSLGASPLVYLELASDRLPAEHSILLPERASRTGREEIVARDERLDVATHLFVDVASWSPGTSERWTAVFAAPYHRAGEPFAAHPATRAPPG